MIKKETHFAKLWHLRRFDRIGQRHRVRRVYVVMMRRASADTEPSRETAVIPRSLQEIHIVHRHVLRPPLVAKCTRLMQRVSQLTIASVKSEQRVFTRCTSSIRSDYVTRLNLLNTDITLLTFVIRREIVIRRRAPRVLASGGLRGRV